MDAKPTRAWKERYRKRVTNFLRRAHEISSQFGADIYVVAYRDGKYHVFSSSDRDGWPPTAEKIPFRQQSSEGPRISK
ncbi:hypothetical protein DIS24_g5924 [Lasiodiplodia hormozganensis]|uniref:MADS-box domain-containing protein n=1 Tax=Lasiodiplodia hormozganensis TaxID=869390 RepID=A0AA39YKE8_9PEZI|nr:hypothetical protein DIS24_g5924 [Lasiodiplodia hormozganensis]